MCALNITVISAAMVMFELISTPTLHTSMTTSAHRKTAWPGASKTSAFFEGSFSGASKTSKTSDSTFAASAGLSSLPSDVAFAAPAGASSLEAMSDGMS